MRKGTRVLRRRERKVGVCGMMNPSKYVFQRRKINKFIKEVPLKIQLN